MLSTFSDFSLTVINHCSVFSAVHLIAHKSFNSKTRKNISYS